MQSVVIEYNETRGYGFIKNGNDDTRDIFYHVSNVLEEEKTNPPKQGERVRFTVDVNEKGFYAKNIRRA